MNQNIQYMLYGLMAAWVIVVAYVVHLTLRERRLRKELDRVKHMVESGEKRA